VEVQGLNGRFFDGKEQAVFKPVVVFFGPFIEDP
jgi:hypothetical protein